MIIMHPKRIFTENILFFILLFVLTVAIYANTLNGQFLSADDIPGIVNNPMVTDLTGSLNTFEFEQITHAVFYYLFGMTPLPYHITSVLMHFINSVLVFIFVSMLFGKKEAIITTLVFLLHPINSETVSWISAYGYLFYAFLTLTIFISFLMWNQTKIDKYLYISIGVYIFSIIFYRKTWVALIPVYVFLLDQFILESKFSLKKMKAYILLAIPTIVFVFVYIRSLFASRQDLLLNLYYNSPENATPYFNRALYTIFMTMKLFLWPVALTIYHEGEKVKSLQAFTVFMIIVTIMLLGLLYYLTFSKVQPNLYKRQIGGLILLIYSTMLMSFYPEVVVWAMAERYLYIASIFFGLIVAILFVRIKNKQLVTWLLVFLLSFYAIRTFVRTNAWKSSKSLWIATQKISPYSYRVYNNLGDVYAAEGNYPEAIKNFQTSIQMYPKFADAVHNLGFTYYQMGDLEQSKYYLQRSYEMNPRLYQTLHKLGVIAFQQGDVQLAKQYLQKTLELNPNFAPAITNLKYIESLTLPVAP